jgi:hypothetical protein
MDVHGKIRKVPVSINNVKPWPDRQTLLEQFEKYEVLKRKVAPPDMAGTLVSAPDIQAESEKEPGITIDNSLQDMVVDEVALPTPTPIVPLVEKSIPTPVKPLTEPLDLDYERYFDDDFDVFG